MRTASGRFVPQSDRSGKRDGDTPQVGLPGVRQLRKPKAQPEASRPKTELELVRERMAKKMQERLRELEEQDVADSWEDEDEASGAGAEQDGAQAGCAPQPARASEMLSVPSDHPVAKGGATSALQRQLTRSNSDGQLEYV